MGVHRYGKNHAFRGAYQFDHDSQRDMLWHSAYMTPQWGEIYQDLPEIGRVIPGSISPYAIASIDENGNPSGGISFPALSVEPATKTILGMPIWIIVILVLILAFLVLRRK